MAGGWISIWFRAFAPGCSRATQSEWQDFLIPGLCAISLWLRCYIWTLVVYRSGCLASIWFWFILLWQRRNSVFPAWNTRIRLLFDAKIDILSCTFVDSSLLLLCTWLFDSTSRCWNQTSILEWCFISAVSGCINSRFIAVSVSVHVGLLSFAVLNSVPPIWV